MNYQRWEVVSLCEASAKRSGARGGQSGFLARLTGGLMRSRRHKTQRELKAVVSPRSVDTPEGGLCDRGFLCRLRSALCCCYIIAAVVAAKGWRVGLDCGAHYEWKVSPSLRKT